LVEQLWLCRKIVFSGSHVSIDPICQSTNAYFLVYFCTLLSSSLIYLLIHTGSRRRGARGGAPMSPQLWRGACSDSRRTDPRATSTELALCSQRAVLTNRGWQGIPFLIPREDTWRPAREPVSSSSGGCVEGGGLEAAHRGGSLHARL